MYIYLYICIYTLVGLQSSITLSVGFWIRQSGKSRANLKQNQTIEAIKLELSSLLPATVYALRPSYKWPVYFYIHFPIVLWPS